MFRLVVALMGKFHDRNTFGIQQQSDPGVLLLKGLNPAFPSVVSHFLNGKLDSLVNGWGSCLRFSLTTVRFCLLFINRVAVLEFCLQFIECLNWFFKYIISFLLCTRLIKKIFFPVKVPLNCRTLGCPCFVENPAPNRALGCFPVSHVTLADW